MNSRFRKKPFFATMAALCLVFQGPAAAQPKPPESASKVRKVLLYNKVGGWMGITALAEVQSVFSTLSAAKGFELVQLADDAGITLDYLKQFQVIVWNNNTNGAASVPSTLARTAILDYLNQGGGWMLIHNAGDHGGSWPGLAQALGTTFSVTGKNGQAEVRMDSAGRAHRELKWMVAGFPEAFRLEDRWLNFMNTVRPLPGVTVVATSRGIVEHPNVIVSTADGSGDNVYLWAREVGKGRLFYNAIGFGNYQLMEQQDSIVPKLYWENLRYAAGDYQNGCTTPGSPGFDPAARVHDEALCVVTGLKPSPAGSDLIVSKGRLRLRFATPAGSLRVRLRDLRGALAWERALSAGTGEIALDGGIDPGVYHLELRGTDAAIQRRIVLP